MKIIIGITGASGSFYTLSLLEKIKKMSQITCELIITPNGKKVWDFELKTAAIPSFTTYQHDDMFAPPASGTAGYDAMIICPCSMGTMAKIAHGIADNLLTRAADVMLKERKKLILVIRESPLSLIHIDNMKTVTLAGAIVMPASPGFYFRPSSMDEMADHFTDHILQLSVADSDGRQWGTNFSKL